MEDEKAVSAYVACTYKPCPSAWDMRDMRGRATGPVPSRFRDFKSLAV